MPDGTRGCQPVSLGGAAERQLRSRGIPGTSCTLSPPRYLKNALDVLPLRAVALGAFLDTMRITDKLKELLCLFVGKNRIQNQIFVCAQPLGFLQTVLSNPVL